MDNIESNLILFQWFIILKKKKVFKKILKENFIISFIV